MVEAAGMRRSGRRELGAIMVLAWLAFLAIPVTLSPTGLSWDALNHHVYLGWLADNPGRLDRDFLPAGYQSLQFPYLYWPVYKLSALGAGPVTAGMVLATLNLVAVPPVWMIARTCMPGEGAAEVALRAMAVLLAFLSGIVLSMFDSTSNDLLAAVPLVWAVALGLAAGHGERWRFSQRQLLVLSGLAAGVSVACKLSNGPLAVLLLLFWLRCGAGARERMLNTLLACLATAVGLALAYGYWGVQLWTHFGNPIYPFYDDAFDPVRAWAGWTP